MMVVFVSGLVFAFFAFDPWDTFLLQAGQRSLRGSGSENQKCCAAGTLQVGPGSSGCGFIYWNHGYINQSLLEVKLVSLICWTACLIQNSPNSNNFYCLFGLTGAHLHGVGKRPLKPCACVSNTNSIGRKTILGYICKRQGIYIKIMSPGVAWAAAIMCPLSVFSITSFQRSPIDQVTSVARPMYWSCSGRIRNTVLDMNWRAENWTSVHTFNHEGSKIQTKK